MQQATPRPRTVSRARHWLGCALVAAAVLGAGAGDAATLSAVPDSLTIAVGQTIQIDLVLELAPGEEASVFEGYFDLIGVGTSVFTPAPGALTPGGPTWGSSFGGIVGTQVVLSLLSDNTGGNRLIGRLGITGLAAGIFEIKLASGTFAQQDISTPPFEQNVPITTPIGAVLTFVTVSGTPPQVPALGALPALALAASLALSGRQARALRFIRPRSLPSTRS